MDNKKELIIQSAINVFREKGIEKTKISDIVKGAGIAQGTFYLYFSSKFAVMPSIAEVMVERMLDEIRDNLKDDSTFAEKLEKVIEAVFQITSEYREIFALIYSGLAATEYLKEWETIYAPYYAWMSELLTQAKDAGVIRKSLHVMRTAEVLIGLIESAADQSYLYSQVDTNTIELKKKEVLEFARYALGLKGT
ncbi:TetR family transcriptional regulator [Virgibacillus oceani]|uniref:TetR family transcriptional regulator n=1 Tax=Virgibacillus oceani TaxID=1479511 RepID=A0A917H9F8_9BACI|nr:TetR family transcriptional regulator [Virgibacillus oceani]GGG71845.1 TetR family transcriptional regulator [Virgibacillus oceani]